MEYRCFEYTNADGQVELQRGSWVGVAVSWVILKSLKMSLLLVIAGLGFSVIKYFDPALGSVAFPAAYAMITHLASQAHPLS
jgi:hypothetical protein